MCSINEPDITASTTVVRTQGTAYHQVRKTLNIVCEREYIPKCAQPARSWSYWDVAARRGLVQAATIDLEYAPRPTVARRNTVTARCDIAEVRTELGKDMKGGNNDDASQRARAVAGFSPHVDWLPDSRALSPPLAALNEAS